MEIGRICMKIAGRDAGRLCVVTSVIDDITVVIDGQTRRRKCNVKHLEPLDKVIDIQEDADHESVISAFKELNIEIVDRRSKKPAPKPVRKRKVPEKKVVKKVVKKTVKKVEKVEKPEKTELKAA